MDVYEFHTTVQKIEIFFKASSELQQDEYHDEYK